MRGNVWHKAQLGMALAALAVALLTASTAEAKPVVVGSPLTGEFAGGAVRNPGTYFNTALPEAGANLASPVDGVIIHFTVVGGEGPGYRLRVLAPRGGSVYTAKAMTPLITFGGEEPHFRPLKIAAGDTIGLDLPGGGKIGAVKGNPASAFAAWTPPLAAGATLPYTGTKTEIELGFNAEVLPRPTVTKVVPKTLAAGKEGRVKIYGEDFQQVSRVSFGNVHPLRFRVASEHLIVATLRPRGTRLETHVRVRTVAGTSQAGPGSRFLFSG